jgi:uncharacterized protein YqkB
MAIYHKGLKHHADEIEKHDITKEELEFLIALQKEMNTQDHVSQADPRFWVIKGSEKLYRVEGEEDGIELYDTEGCSTDADGIEEIVKYIQENFLEDINSCYGDSYKVSVEKGIFHDSIAIDNKDEMFDELGTAEEITEWLHKFGYDEYEAIPYKIIPKIYEDTMFLTQKAAEEHLRGNSHHYSEDAHTYAMTAWRSPDVDKLWKILQTVDFSFAGKE